MKKLLLIGVLLLISSFAFSDEIQIPLECYPKQLQEKFAKVGKKLDLDGNDRDANSWGFLENKGASFNIITYKQVSVDDLKEIQKIVMEK